MALVPEPDNPHDGNAVAIYDEDVTLQRGYVPAAVAPSSTATSRPSRSGASTVDCAC
ncbi:hypothetical protein BH20ACT13_BH20ACT13_00900 [soil metagenome]